MPILKNVIISFICILVSTSSAFALSGQVLDTKDSVFNIITYLENNEGDILQGSGTGTGFLINNNGGILTNNHVVDTQGLYKANLRLLLQAVAKKIGCDLSNLTEPCKNKLDKVLIELKKAIREYKPKIKVVDGNKIIESNLRNAEILWKKEEQDIALLQVNGFEGKPIVVLSEIIPEQLDEVFAVGFPGVTSSSRLDHETVEASITDGSISVLLEDGVRGITSRVIQHNADVNPGNSGGPLVDSCGRVVGINTQAVTENGGRTTQGIYFSSHISSAISILKDNNVSFTSTSEICSTSSEEASKRSLYGILASIFGVIVALIAIIFSLKKPRQQIINTIETYTHYIKRGGKKHPSDKSLSSHTSEKTWKLSGSIKDTGERINIEITENDLKNEKGVTIGRNRKLCDYAIPDVKRLSRRHARFICKNGELMVEDLNSSNKTYIDNRELIPGKASPLSSGSVLSLGKAVYLTLS